MPGVSIGTRICDCCEWRGASAADVDALEQVLLRVSEMVCELPEIEELDIKPLIADEHGVVAVDARIQLRRLPAARRYAHLAIHPYPVKLAREVRLRDGTRLLLRPIRPEDAEMELEFVRRLSETSRYLRFMNALRELSPAMLARFTQIDYDRDMAFIALQMEDVPGRQVGVVRYVSNPDGSSCEFAMAVADTWQGKGLGTILLTVLIEAALESSLEVMVGCVLAHNHKMLDLCEGLGFSIADDPADLGVKVVTLLLRPGLP